jgi:hypothetical protein
MFIDSRLHKVFAAPEERNVAEVNSRLQHFALWSFCLLVTFRINKTFGSSGAKRICWPLEWFTLIG